MIWKRHNRARASLEDLARRAGKDVGKGLVGSLAIRQDFTYTFRFVCRGHRIRCSANDRLLWLDLSGVSTCLAFSVGRPIRMSGIEERVARTVGRSRLPIYRDPGYISQPSLEEWLTSPSGATGVEDLDLRTGDALHVYPNGISLYLVPRERDATWEMLDKIVRLAALLPPAKPVELAEGEELLDGLPFDARRLPEQFHGLLPYLREWAITDDEDRVDKLKEASTQQLETMDQAVSPHLGAINEYLDAVCQGEIYEEPDRYESVLLWVLGECAEEAQTVLQERNEGSPGDHAGTPDGGN